VMVQPRSRVYHVGGASLARSDPRKARYNFRNSLLMLYKNLPAREWSRVFVARLALDGLAALRFSIRGEFRQTMGVFLAYAEAHRMKTRYPRPESTRARPSYRRSIAVDYWFRRLRKFSELDPGEFELGSLRGERQSTTTRALPKGRKG
jgi:hypothetical protein